MSDRPISLVPSLPAASWAELAALADAFAGVCPELQIDLVDGKFVPHTSWPFTETDPAAALRAAADLRPHFALEFDCMIEAPEQYLDTFVAVGAARVVVHIGSTDQYDRIIDHARAHQYKLGFAINNDRPLELLLEHIEAADYVQLMGIAAVGQQGQPFDPRTLDRVRELRAQFPELEIAVDGSVNAKTIPELLAAGVNRFAPGSAIAKQANPAAAYEQLHALLHA